MTDNIELDKTKEVSSSNEKSVIKGRFVKGNKAGKGRPQGSKTRIQIAIEEMGEDVISEAFEVIKAAVKNKDLNAAKYIVERLKPPRRTARFKFALPVSIDSIEQFDEATKNVVRMMSEGDISIEEAKMIVEVINVRATALEYKDFKGQFERLRNDMDNLMSSRDGHIGYA